MPEWLIAVLSIGGTTVGVVVTYLGARRLGLTDLQKAVRVETDTLVDRLRVRVVLLESENKALLIQLEQLRVEGAKMRGRIDDLEEALANNAVNRRPRIARGEA